MTIEYLTVSELAERLKLSPKSVRNKMASGAFRQGVHYFRPPGMAPRFKWSAVVEWLEQSQETTAVNDDSIPMPRHYRRRESRKENLVA